MKSSRDLVLVLLLVLVVGSLGPLSAQDTADDYKPLPKTYMDIDHVRWSALGLSIAAPDADFRWEFMVERQDKRLFLRATDNDTGRQLHVVAEARPGPVPKSIPNDHVHLSRIAQFAAPDHPEAFVAHLPGNWTLHVPNEEDRTQIMETGIPTPGKVYPVIGELDGRRVEITPGTDATWFDVLLVAQRMEVFPPITTGRTHFWKFLTAVIAALGGVALVMVILRIRHRKRLAQGMR